MKQLSTSRTLLSFLFPRAIVNDLNTIIGQADGQTSHPRDANSFFRLYSFNQRINRELERRSLDYRIPRCFCKKGSFFLNLLIIPSFIEMSKVATAMNVLAADYNERG